MFNKKFLYLSVITILGFISIVLWIFFFFNDQAISINIFKPNIKENIDKLNDLSVYYNDRKIEFSNNLYIVNNRIFLPVNDVIDSIESMTNANRKNHNLNLNQDDEQVFTRTIGNEQYISIQNLESLSNLKSQWDFKNSSIKLFDKKEIIKSNRNNNSKIALMRLEDISPGGYYSDSVNLEKLRIISDLLASRGVTFHIAWIPRHIDPSSGYDCDPASNNSLYASEFIYTLDYLINHGGIVGLHGYTHQYKKSRTGEGYEFFSTTELKVPSSPKYARKRIEKSIESANTLGIKYYFFECPHYAASPNQLKEIEKYFQYIYQPNLDYNIKTNNGLVIKQNNVYYVPTPLGYYSKGNNITDKLNMISDKTLASFFFHPMIEFKYINLKENDEYEYSNESPLHNIVDAFEKKGYKFESISNLRK